MMLMKTIVAATIICVTYTAYLHADLKYTVHIEMSQSAPGSDVVSAAIERLLVGIIPEGGVDQVVIIGERGTRSELKQPCCLGKTVGTITLVMADGSVVKMNPTAMVFERERPNPSEVTRAEAMRARISIQQRPDADTVGGRPAQHDVLTMGTLYPVPPGTSPPPDFPGEFMGTFDFWATNTVKRTPDEVAASNVVFDVLKTVGVDATKDLTIVGLVLKGTISYYGTQLVMTTKDFSTVPAAADRFEIPAGYTDVPAGTIR